MTELWRLSATELAAKIAARDVSPVEVMRETLARIDAVNGAVNAVVALRDREAVMGEARLAEAMPATGPLHGVPIAIKDTVAVKGVPSTWGVPFLADFVPDEDEVMVARLQAAGVIIIGKTNVPMFAVGSHSKNPVYGATRNPYDLRVTVGGSSGGAGAALATGMLSLADGSDMMGSLRNPGAWNGVYGFRPTVGLIPPERSDAAMGGPISTRGPMARSIEDLELLLGVQSGGAHVPGDAPNRAPKVGWLGDWGGAFAFEDGLMTQAEGALRVMEGLGWSVEPLAPPMPREALWQSWTDLRSFLLALDQGPNWGDPERRAVLNTQIVWEIERGRAMTGETVDQAAALRRQWLAVLADLFETCDLLVLPSAQVWPFPVEIDWPTEIAGQGMDTYHRWMEVMIPASLAGVPVLNLPTGLGANGLPSGVQLIGKAGSDAQLLAWAKAYEAAIGPAQVVTPDAA